MRLGGVDGLEEGSSFILEEDGSGSLGVDDAGPSDGGRRVHVENSTGDEVIEKMFDGGEMLLDAGGGELLAQVFDIGGDDHRPESLKIEASFFTPEEKATGRSQVGVAGVGVFGSVR